MDSTAPNDMLSATTRLSEHQARMTELLQNVLCAQQETLSAQREALSAQTEMLETQRQILAAEQAAQERRGIPSRKFTSPKPPSDAGTRLTGTFELLERILLCLECEQVFWLQGLTRQFRDTIANSLPLQRKIYMAPAPQQDGLVAPRINPLLLMKSERNQVHVRLPLYCDAAEQRFAYIARPGRERIFVGSIDFASGSSPKMTVKLMWKGYKEGSDGYCLDKLQRGDLGHGSWKQMYLTQPPCDMEWTFIFEERWSTLGRSGHEIVNTQVLELRRTTKEHLTMDGILDRLAEETGLELLGEVEQYTTGRKPAPRTIIRTSVERL